MLHAPQHYENDRGYQVLRARDPNLADMWPLYKATTCLTLNNTVDYGVDDGTFADACETVENAIRSFPDISQDIFGYESADIKIPGPPGFRAWGLSESQLHMVGVDPAVIEQQKNLEGQLPIVVTMNGLLSKDFAFLQKLRMFWQKQGYLAVVVECSPYTEEGGALHVHSFAERDDFFLHCIHMLATRSGVDRNRMLIGAHSIGASVPDDSWERLTGEIDPMGLFGFATPTPLFNTARSFPENCLAFLLPPGSRLVQDVCTAMVPASPGLPYDRPKTVPKGKRGMVFNRGDWVNSSFDFGVSGEDLGFVCHVGAPLWDHDLLRAFTRAAGGELLPLETVIQRIVEKGGPGTEDVIKQKLIIDILRLVFKRHINDIFRQVPTFGWPDGFEELQTARLFFLGRMFRSLVARTLLNYEKTTGDRSARPRLFRTFTDPHNFENEQDATAAIAAMWCFVKYYLGNNTGTNARVDAANP